MVKLLLGAQCKKDFMTLKKTKIKDFVASYSTTSIVIPRKIIEDSFKMMVNK